MTTPILVLDCSLHGAFCGLIDVDSKKYLWHAVIPSQGGRSHQLLEVFKQGLSLCACSPTDLAGFAVGCGPGSFTGIKMGLAFTYGLAASFPPQDRRVLCLNTLQELGRKWQEKIATPSSTSAVFWAATRRHGFVAMGDQDMATSIFDLNQEDKWSQEWRDRTDSLSDILFIGDWDAGLATHFKNFKQKQEALSLVELYTLIGEALLAKVIAVWPEDFLNELPRPAYGRKSTAEEARDAKQGV